MSDSLGAALIEANRIRVGLYPRKKRYAAPDPDTVIDKYLVLGYTVEQCALIAHYSQYFPAFNLYGEHFNFMEVK